MRCNNETISVTLQYYRWSLSLLLLTLTFIKAISCNNFTLHLLLFLQACDFNTTNGPQIPLCPLWHSCVWIFYVLWFLKHTCTRTHMPPVNATLPNTYSTCTTFWKQSDLVQWAVKLELNSFFLSSEGDLLLCHTGLCCIYCSQQEAAWPRGWHSELWVFVGSSLWSNVASLLHLVRHVQCVCVCVSCAVIFT